MDPFRQLVIYIYRYIYIFFFYEILEVSLNFHLWSSYVNKAISSVDVWLARLSRVLYLEGPLMLAV